MATTRTPQTGSARAGVIPVRQDTPHSALRTPHFSSFLAALRRVESSGLADPPDGDGGAAIGPYQIHEPYWRDARLPEGNYQDCRDPGYARRAVLAYLLRWCPEALRAEDWQVCARVHNGGPRGATDPRTLPYWRKVRAALDGNAECGMRSAERKARPWRRSHESGR